MVHPAFRLGFKNDPLAASSFVYYILIVHRDARGKNPKDVNVKFWDLVVIR